MYKFSIPPDAAGYTTEDSAEVIAIKLDGGASRYRRDKTGSTSKVSVKWSFDREEYRYFRGFFNQLVQKGADPFLIDLVLDLPDPLEHRAYFVPGTVRLTEQRGHYYGVTAELEVYHTDTNTSDEAEFAGLYGAFGPDYATTFPPFDDQLNTLVNTTLPGDL
jgi:hypothetical protein